MQNRTDLHKVRLRVIKYRMRLKVESTNAVGDFGLRPPDAGKTGEQVKHSLEAGVVGVGLIGAEGCFGVFMNINKILFRPFGKTEFSRCVWPRVVAR